MNWTFPYESLSILEMRFRFNLFALLESRVDSCVLVTTLKQPLVIFVRSFVKRGNVVSLTR